MNLIPKKTAIPTLADVLEQLLSGRTQRDEFEKTLQAFTSQWNERLYTTQSVEASTLTFEEVDAIIRWMTKDQKKALLTGTGYSIEAGETITIKDTAGLSRTLVLKSGKLVSYEDKQTGLITARLLGLFKEELPILDEIITKLGLGLAEDAILLILRNKETALRNELSIAKRKVAEKQQDIKVLNSALKKVLRRLKKRVR